MSTKWKVLLRFIVIVIVFALGMAAGVYWLAPSLTQQHYSEKTVVEQPTIVQGTVETKTQTQIAYVPKETVVYVDKATGQKTTALEKTDIDANIGKTELNVKLNGKNIQFTQTDDEQYVLEKNKVALQQNSKVTFDVKVEPPVIDKTKRWSLGVGYDSDGIVYTADFPIGNNNSVGGWVYSGAEKAAGIKFRF